MNKAILDTAERIKKLEIQGARNVAIAALKIIESEAKKTNSKTLLRNCHKVIQKYLSISFSRLWKPFEVSLSQW